MADMNRIWVKPEYAVILKRNRLYKKFIANLVIECLRMNRDPVDKLSILNRKSTFRDFICHAFSFIDTREGLEFWLNVSTLKKENNEN